MDNLFYIKLNKKDAKSWIYRPFSEQVIYPLINKLINGFILSTFFVFSPKSLKMLCPTFLNKVINCTMYEYLKLKFMY